MAFSSTTKYVCGALCPLPTARTSRRNCSAGMPPAKPTPAAISSFVFPGFFAIQLRTVFCLSRAAMPWGVIFCVFVNLVSSKKSRSRRTRHLRPIPPRTHMRNQPILRARGSELRRRASRGNESCQIPGR